MTSVSSSCTSCTRQAEEMQKGANDKGSLCCLGHKETQWGSDWILTFITLVQSLSRTHTHTDTHTCSMNKQLLHYCCVNVQMHTKQVSFHYTFTHTHTHFALNQPRTIHAYLGWQIFDLLIFQQTWMEETGCRETPTSLIMKLMLPLTVREKEKSDWRTASMSSSQENFPSFLHPSIHDAFKIHFINSLIQLKISKTKMCLLFLFVSFVIRDCKRVTQVPRRL